MDIINIAYRFAGVILFNDKKQVLLLLRNDMPCWELPGGIVEDDETFEDAALRETKEEIDRDVTLERMVGETYEYEDVAKQEFIHSKYYLGVFNDDRPVYTDEHVGFKWFQVNDMPRNMGGLCREMIMIASKEYNQSRARMIAKLSLEHIHDLDMWKNSPKVAAKRKTGAMQFDPFAEK